MNRERRRFMLASALAPGADHVGRIMIANGLLRGTPVLQGLADPRFLPEST